MCCPSTPGSAAGLAPLRRVWPALLAGLLPGLAVAALSPCHLPGLSQAVQCDTIGRPLDPAAPAGQRISLAIAMVPAKARGKRDDPVYFLAGGPGQSARSLIGAVLPALQRLGNRRDLVFVDQRGTGASAPLECPPDSVLPLSQSAPQQVARRMRECQAALQRLPYGDLRQFTTSIAAGDLDAVREHLGHERINLIGVSYGTRLALEYQRQFPQRVRRAVLDGVVPSDVELTRTMAEDAEAVLERLLKDCASDAICRRDHPQLRANWQRLLEARATTVSLANPLSGISETLQADGQLAATLVRGPLYAPALAAGLPDAIDRAAGGDWSGLAGLASAVGGRPGQSLAMGMHFSVLCAEDTATQSGPVSGPFGHLLGGLYATVCQEWPRGTVPAAFRSVSPAASAVLLMSGGRDPATPSRHADRVATALGPLARHVVVAEAGHGILMAACAPDVAYEFINADDDRQALAVDAHCLDGMPAPPAYRPLRLRLEDRP